MAEFSSLEALEFRKRLLVARSEIQRQTLRLEVARLQEATAWVPQAARCVKDAAPWLLLAAPAARLLLGRRRRPMRSLAAGALAGWRLYRQLRWALDWIGRR